MDDAIRHALYGIAGELQVRAFEADIRDLYEADLRAATRRAVHLATGRKVVVEAKVALRTWKAGTGGVDVGVVSAKASTFDALIEVKWWRSASKAIETIWDAWKLASAYKEGLAGAAFLVSGAPRATWDGSSRGVQLWNDGTWKTREWWTADVIGGIGKRAGPVELPPGIRTRLVGDVPIHVFGREPWALRCIRVTTTPGAPVRLEALPVL